MVSGILIVKFYGFFKKIYGLSVDVLIIVNISNSIFTPHEFDKLIDATNIIKEQASKNRASQHKEITLTEETNQEKDDIGVIEKRELWEINVLQSGELVLINMPSPALAPSEFNDFIEVLKKTKNLTTKLRLQKKNNNSQ